MTFTELESDNVKLRAEIAELRDLYTTALEKLGTVAALVGFEPDRALPVIVDQTHMKLAGLPALNGKAVEAAARWLEDYWRAILKEGEISTAGTPVGEKTETSWSICAHEAQLLIDALRRR